MPGGGNGLEKKASNYYSYVYKGIYFLTVNWDYVFLDGQNNLPEVLRWLKQDLEKMDKMPEIKYRFFFSHKPFYCTMPEDDCVNFYLFKPVESLLYKYQFDLILNSHVHLYYRHKKLTPSMLIDKSENSVYPQMLISGHQGIDPDRGGNKETVEKKRRGRLEITALAGQPQLLVLDFQSGGIKLTLAECDSFFTLDETFIPYRLKKPLTVS